MCRVWLVVGFFLISTSMAFFTCLADLKAKKTLHLSPVEKWENLEQLSYKLNPEEILPEELIEQFKNNPKTLKKIDMLGRNILFYSIKYDPFYKIQKLVQQGVKIDLQDKFGETPLHWAAFLNRIDVVRYLWARMPKKTKDHLIKLYHSSLLDEIVIEGHQEVAAFLYNQGFELKRLNWPNVYEHNYVRKRTHVIKWLDSLAEQGLFTPPTPEKLAQAQKEYVDFLNPPSADDATLPKRTSKHKTIADKSQNELDEFQKNKQDLKRWSTLQTQIAAPDTVVAPDHFDCQNILNVM